MALDIRGIGIGGFRSFRGPVQRIGPLSRINLFAGQNNTGKSNILRFAQAVLPALSGKGIDQLSVPALQGFDVPQGGNEPAHVISVALESTDVLSAISASTTTLGAQHVHAIEATFATQAFRATGGELVWLDLNVEPSRRPELRVAPSESQAKSAVEQLDRGHRPHLVDASVRLTGTGGGDDHIALMRMLAKAIRPFDSYNGVQTIEAFRQVQARGDNFANFSGDGLIAGLARLQNPSANRLEDRARFETISGFVQSVLDEESARLDVPYERDTINVDIRGLTMPLENLGTGVHEVVILAVASTLIQGSIVCIEEPEIHLHPLLQRKLLRYLAGKTNNTYLIATHSAHLLDAEFGSIFHVTLEADGTKVRQATSPKELSDICSDLGYRPSDLLQANAVIWVEGPSDRVYLRKWISIEAPDLIEGIHYSIMFYGGRLLSHLSADDPEINEFISLRRLNRHITIVIDSDKHASRSRISETKKRVSREFEAGPGFSWITKGYTIENYVPPALLAASVGTVHVGARLTWAGEQYVNPLARLRGGPKVADKVGIAHAATEAWDASVDWPLDLRTRVRQVVRFIRVANGH